MANGWNRLFAGFTREQPRAAWNSIPLEQTQRADEARCNLVGQRDFIPLTPPIIVHNL
jgi:hypothetical protein